MQTIHFCERRKTATEASVWGRAVHSNSMNYKTFSVWFIWALILNPKIHRFMNVNFSVNREHSLVGFHPKIDWMDGIVSPRTDFIWQTSYKRWKKGFYFGIAKRRHFPFPASWINIWAAMLPHEGISHHITYKWDQVLYCYLWDCQVARHVPSVRAFSAEQTTDR